MSIRRPEACGLKSSSPLSLYSLQSVYCEGTGGPLFIPAGICWNSWICAWRLPSVHKDLSHYLCSTLSLPFFWDSHYACVDFTIQRSSPITGNAQLTSRGSLLWLRALEGFVHGRSFLVPWARGHTEHHDGNTRMELSPVSLTSEKEKEQGLGSQDPLEYSHWPSILLVNPTSSSLTVSQ